MFLESYVGEMCIGQKEETLRHLFLRCNFVKRCWQLIGITYPNTIQPIAAFKLFRRKLNVNFSMEIIILMTWAIWTTRNDWIFNQQDPSVDRCKAKFIHEFSMFLHRAKAKYFPAIKEWLEALM